MLTAVQIFVGLALLGFGRRLFWLFVGVLGFLAGFALASQLFQNASNQVTLIIAIVFGVLGIIFAMSTQKLAVGVAGFIAGGYIAYTLLSALGYENIWFWLGTFLVFGAIGSALVMLVFNAALVILTSITGALLVLRAVPIQPPELLLVVLFLIMIVGGIALQVSQLNK